MNTLNRLLPAIAGAVAGGAIALVIASGSSTKTVTTTAVAPARSAALPASVTKNKGTTINQIYKQASPGVVDIRVTQSLAGGDLGQFGFGGGTQQGEGSGVVYDTQGHILTDEHVVANAQSIQVKFSGGRTAGAKVVGTDPSTDVAVIKVDVPASDLHPLPLADSSSAQVGDPVIAIGSPFGHPETVTQGIVSAVNRSIQAPNQYTITGSIQTDAAINPGNSGGPLLDASGRVLGLNDQINTNSQSNAGVGFAVPSNTAARVAQEIIGGKVVKHSYLGVSLDPNSSGGATIRGGQTTSGVRPGSPAESAGLRAGDTITAINGKAITATDQLISTIDTYSPGTTVTLTIKRGGQTQNVQVKLGTRPSGNPAG